MTRQQGEDSLFTIRTPIHKLAITTILTPTRTINRTPDTSHSFALTLPLHTRGVPEKRKCIFTRRHLGSRSAVVGFTCAVGGAVGFVVLVVDGEDSKGLLAETRIVAAFCGLDCFTCFRGWEGGELANED